MFQRFLASASLRRKYKPLIRIHFGRYLHFHRLLAEFFMHRYQRIFAGRQVLDRISAISRAYGKIWVRHHVDIRSHPRMLVALHWNHHLRRGKSLADGLVGGHL